MDAEKSAWNTTMLRIHLGIFLKCRLQVCRSRKLPGNTDTASPETPLRAVRV